MLYIYIYTCIPLKIRLRICIPLKIGSSSKKKTYGQKIKIPHKISKILKKTLKSTKFLSPNYYSH